MGNCNTCVLNDQDRMEDLLAQEKYLIGAYSTFIPEATCPELRTVLKDNFQDCVQNQYSIFDKKCTGRNERIVDSDKYQVLFGKPP